MMKYRGKTPRNERAYLRKKKVALRKNGVKCSCRIKDLRI